MLVFLLLQQLTGTTWRSLSVATLFAVHPLRVESVAWISELKDVLSGAFGLLALICYARYAKTRGREERGETVAPAMRSYASRASTQDYLLALLFFALGLMSKPMLVTWPFAMLLLDYWPLRRLELVTPASPRRTLARLIVEKVPFFLLAGVASVLTFITQQEAGSVIAVRTLPLEARVSNALVTYCRYLGKLVWPSDLAAFYPHPGQWPIGAVLLAGGFMLAVSVLVFVGRRRAPFALMGWLWFCGTLAPVIGLVQAGEQAMADRYTYLPAIGVLVIIVWGACNLTGRWQHSVIVQTAVVLTAVIMCVGATRQQLGYWKDDETLWRHALEVTPKNYFAHKSLGDAFLHQGRLDDAIAQYQDCIGLNPNFASVYGNFGTALLAKGQLDEAARQFQQAVRLNPRNAEAYYNLGTAFLKQGRLDDAIRQFQLAIQLKSDEPDYHYNLATALRKHGLTDEAIFQYQEVLRLNSDDPEAHNNLGILLSLKGQTQKAIHQYHEALRLKPDFPAARTNLDNLLGAKPKSDLLSK